MVKRKRKSTLLLYAKKTASVRKLTTMIADVTNVGPENRMLYEKEQCMNDNKPLTECGLNSYTIKVQASATMGLAFRDPDSGKF